LNAGVGVTECGGVWAKARKKSLKVNTKFEDGFAVKTGPTFEGKVVA